MPRPGSATYHPSHLVNGNLRRSGAGAGRGQAFEVKLGRDEAIDAAAASLRKFADGINTDKCGQPGALAVITAIGYGYVREDGVAVYPLTTLGP